jgi:uncharacterized protein (TIGR02271 family)
MAKTVIGLYDDIWEAKQVVSDLVDEGFARDQISLIARDEEGKYANALDREKTGGETGETHAGTGAAGGAVAGGIIGLLVGLGAFVIPGIGPVVAAGPIMSGLIGLGIGAAGGGLLGGLVGMGIPKEEAEYYSEGVRRGGIIVAVNTPDHEVSRTTAIMNRHNPVDIEQRASQWREEGWTGYDREAEPYAGREHQKETIYHQPYAGEEKETKIPVMEEDFRVGKREVDRGTVRVHTFVEKEPVEKEVELRREHVNVERRRVDRPISEEDLQAFEEGTVEFTESEEEAVVDKRARVSEEVVIKKSVEEHPETVKGTVDRTRVDVERTGEEYGRDVKGYETHRPGFRHHFDQHYASMGGVYSAYEPAYNFGSELTADPKYRGRTWDEIEPEVRQRWESQHKGSWDKFKDAVRHGWTSS